MLNNVFNKIEYGIGMEPVVSVPQTHLYKNHECKHGWFTKYMYVIFYHVDFTIWVKGGILNVGEFYDSILLPL